MGLQQADYFLLKHEELPLLLFRMTSVTVISSLEIIKKCHSLFIFLHNLYSFDSSYLD